MNLIVTITDAINPSREIEYELDGCAPPLPVPGERISVEFNKDSDPEDAPGDYVVTHVFKQYFPDSILISIAVVAAPSNF